MRGAKRVLFDRNKLVFPIEKTVIVPMQKVKLRFKSTKKREIEKILKRSVI